MGDTIEYHIKDRDAKRFVKTLIDYYRFYKSKSETESKALASSGYSNLIKGNDLDGNPITNPNLQHFDEVLSVVTNGYYTPSQTTRLRYKKGVKPKGRPKKNAVQVASGSSMDDAKTQEKVDRIRKNLLTEYPTLDRKDLEDSIDNYCKLIVRINELMSAGSDETIAIKNLTDTQIKLGSFLGIDESAKAKQRQLEDRQSIASLSMKFQRTIDEFPVLMDRMRYKELRLLIEKYDRQELSRELFENPAYAGMSVENARRFIAEREAEYEAK